MVRSVIALCLLLASLASAWAYPCDTRGCTFTGPVTFSAGVTGLTIGSNTTTNSLLQLSGLDTGQKGIRLFSNGNERWRLFSTGANSGNDAGDTLTLQNFHDAGNATTVFQINRATGAMQYNDLFQVGATTAPQTSGLLSYLRGSLTITGGWGSVQPIYGSIVQNAYTYTAIPQWVTATVYPAGSFVSNGTSWYFTTAGGTSGASAPTCGSGSCSDGGVTWIWQTNLSVSRQMIGGTLQAIASANMGGNASDPIGSVFGANFWGSCQGTATFLTGCLGVETDVGISSGASALTRVGEQIVILPNYTNQGSQTDVAWRLTNAGTNSAGWRNLMVWGAPSGGPSSGSEVIDPNGYGLQVSTVGSGPQDLLNGAGAIDLKEFNANGSGPFGGGFLVRTPNGQWNQDGSIQFGHGILKTTSNGASFEAGEYTVTAASVHAAGGGTGWSCTGLFARGTDGTVLQVTGVSGGAVTTLSVQVAGWANAAPSNPITFTPDAFCGTGANGEPLVPSTFTADLTWAQANSGVPLIQINTLGGNTQIGSGSPVATNATAGFPLIPSSAGAPTGTVSGAGTGKVAIEIDTTNKKICYTTGGGTWECSAAFTP